MKTLHSLMVGMSMMMALMVVPVKALAAIDTTQPTTSATLTGTKGTDGWYTTSVTVTLTATDDAYGSGVANTEYSLDNVTWQTYSAPITLDKNGRQLVYFRSTDLAGNVESPAKSLEIMIETGLVGLWDMENSWQDSSINRNDGINYNGATFSPNAKTGMTAGIFDGVDDYVQIANSTSLNPTDQITVAAWYNPKSFSGSGNDSIIDKGYVSHAPPYYQYHLGVSGNRYPFSPASFSFSVAAGGVSHAVMTLPNFWTPGNWYYVVGTYDGAMLKLYVNGVLANSTPASGKLTDYGKDLYIGRFSNYFGYYLPGLIDDVRIYNRALSASEIENYFRTHMVMSPTVNPVTSPTAAPVITLTGTKPANTAIVINGNILVPLNGTTTWQTSYTLSPGENSLAITALDSQNFSSLAVALQIALDNTPPVTPGFDPTTAPINTPSKTITGTKSSDSTTVVVGCAGAVIGKMSYPTVTSWNVNISGLREGSNLITAYAVDAAGNQSATAATTITLDATLPTVGATPAGGVFASAQRIALASNEQTVIYYTTDGSTPVVTSAIYSQPIPIPASTTLKYFARDLAGNSSEIITETYVIDTTPPLLAISTLSDGAYTNNDTLNIAGTVADNTGVTGITVNDVAVQVNPDGSFSQALLLTNGINRIAVTAIDSVGNMATDTRIVTFDQTAPILTVTTPADNSKTGKMLLDVSGSVDETTSVTIKIKDKVESALMNNGTFTATAILEPGCNTIEITAVDLAGNRTSQKRTVVFDDQVPSLAMIAPNQDIRTNQSTLTLRGTTYDALTGVGVTISTDNETFTPPVIDGTFEQTVNFTEEKTYGIVITATNEVGTSASVKRNVIYDITPPTLSIDQLTGPVRHSSMTITGTREAGAEVSVSCATATVGELSYPTATTWQADISGLMEGNNLITAVSTDTAGNSVTATAAVVLATRPPEITITATPDVIWPPDHRMVPVTISGGVSTNKSNVKSVSISVRDEYGKYQFDNLTFGNTIMLEAWRNGNDRDGRKYTITAVVTDKGGIKTTKTATVTVLHSQQSTSGSGNAKVQDTISQLMSRSAKGAVRLFGRK